MSKKTPHPNCPFATNETVDDEKQFTLKEIIVDIHKDVKAINSRVRKNEIKIGYVYGGLALLGIAITIVRFF